MAYRLLRLSNLSDPPVNCKIVISPERNVFVPGDKIEGILIVSHQRDLILRGFKIVLEGTSLTKYKEQEIQHSKSEEFLMEQQYVFGHEMQKNRLAGGAGTTGKIHKFPFSLKIPMDETLPGSFKSSFGLTLYQIVAYMHMDPARFVKKSEKTIHLNSLFTLNDSTLMNIVNIEKSIQKFKFKLTLQQTGYLAGEEIPFEVELENPNGLNVVNIVVSLVQKTTYKAGNVSRLSKTNSTILGTITTKRLDTTGGTIWTNCIRIPPKQRPTQQNGIIEIQYVLKVEVNTNSESPKLRGETSIIIGTARSSMLRSSSGINIPNSNSQNEIFWTEEDKHQNNGNQLLDDDCSLVSTSGKKNPPSYSALSLRRSSLSKSLETLPPEYEDIVFESDEREIDKLNSLVI